MNHRSNTPIQGSPPRVRSHTILTQAFLVLVGSSSIALGEATPTVRYAQPAFPIGAPFLASHQGSNHSNQVFDSVRFSNTELVSEFRWEGVYTNSQNRAANPVEPTTMHWEFSIWSDVNGEPGERFLLSNKVAAEVSREVAGMTSYKGLDIPIYAYRFELPEAFKAEAETTYWFSIYSITSAEYQPSFRLLAGYKEGKGRLAPPDPEFIGHVINESDGSLQKRGGNYLRRAGDRAIAVVTLPFNDSDEDGMDDGWEVEHGLSLEIDDAAADPDEDGDSNLREFERQTAPLNADTDGDGLSDGIESNSGVYIDDHDTGTSPFLADTDGDGLADNGENPSQAYVSGSQSGSDPNLWDTDGDTIADSEELSWLTNPSENDSDGDGISDSWEIANLSDPNDSKDPISIVMASLGEASNQWTLPGVLPTFDKFQGSLDQSDVTFLVSIDFEEKLTGEREVIFETGDGFIGFSLVYESGNRLVLRAMGLKAVESRSDENLLHAKIERVLTASEIAGGEIEVMWGFDSQNDLDTQTIGLWVNGMPASEWERDLGGDWSGRGDAGFGVLGEDEGSLAAAGDTTDLAGIDFASGTINLTTGLRMFAETYPKLESMVLREVKPTILRDQTGKITLHWPSQVGTTYAIDHSTDLLIWSELDDSIGATSQVTTFEDNDPTRRAMSAGFYRVRRVK